jgi:vacuolar-type H+-ATPase subunit C/Vma6
LEVALDLHYWRRLWQGTLNLQGLDQSQALRIIGSLLDMSNLMWAIRYRVYQQLSEEELINYTLPFGYRLRDQDIRTVAAGGDIAALVTRLYPAIQDVAALLAEPRRGLPLLEAELKRHVIRQCEAAFVGNPFHVGVPLAYLVLHDLELQDLILLVEAKDSLLPAETYLPFVLRAPVVAG